MPNSTLELYKQALRNRTEQKNINSNAIPTKTEVANSKNVFERIGDTGQHIMNNLQTGAVKGVEGLFDSLIGIAGTVGTWFGGDDTWAKNIVGYDVTDKVMRFNSGLNANGVLGMVNLGQNWDNIMNNPDYDYKSQYSGSFFNALPDVALDVVDGVSQSIGQMLPSIAIAGLANPGTKLQNVISMGSFGLSAGGNAVEEGVQSGNDIATSTAYGALQGLKEAGTEMIGSKLFGSKIFGALGRGSSKVATDSVKGIIKEFAKESFSEGAEEVIGDIFEPIIKKVTIEKDSDLGEAYSELPQQMLVDFISGAISGGIMNSGSTISKARTFGTKAYSVTDTIQEAHDLLGEASKLEKSGKLTNEKLAKFKEDMSKIEDRYQQQLEATKEKYGETSDKAKNVEAYKDYMDGISKTSPQDFNVNRDIAKFNNKNNGNIGYTSLDGKEYKTSLAESMNMEETEIDDNSNAFIDKEGNIYVNRDSEAYKEGKLYNVIGHELIHSIENSDIHTELFDNYTKSLSVEETSDIIDTYKSVYGEDKSDTYLLQEAFADYIGKSITTDYKSFSKTLGTNSKLSSIIERVFGSKTASNKTNRDIRDNVKKAIKEANGNVNESKENITSGGDKTYERTNEFRGIQEESLRMDDERIRLFHNGSERINEGIRGRLSRVFKEQLASSSRSLRYGESLIVNKNTNKEFKIYSNVNANEFRDIFSIVRNYLPNGDCVDIHNIESSDWSVGYEDCTCYLIENGLAGFAITNKGDLISVFSLKEKGFLKSIKDFITKEGALSLDCYQSEKQYLAYIYSHTIGFKTSSILDFNYDILADDKGKEYADYFVSNYGEAPVHFMVNTNVDIETKHFDKDSYDEAYKYQQSFIEDSKNTKSVKESKKTYTVEESKPKKKAKTIPKETDSAVGIKSFANLTQGKVYNKVDVSKALDYIAKNIQESLGTTDKVTFANKQEIVDNLFHKLNTQVNHSIQDIAYALNESVSNLKINSQPIQGIVELNGESYNGFAKRNIEIFESLLESGSKGKVNRLLSHYKRIVGDLRERLSESKKYTNEMRKTWNKLDTTIDKRIGKIGSDYYLEGIGITELNPIIKKLKEAQNGRTDYIKGDVRDVMAELQNMIASNEVLTELFPEEVMGEIAFIASRVSERTANGKKPKLSVAEMQSLRRILDGINYIYNSYDKIILSEKEESLKEKQAKGFAQFKNKKDKLTSRLYTIGRKLANIIGADKFRTRIAWLQNTEYKDSIGEELENALIDGTNLKLEVKQDLIPDNLKRLFDKYIHRFDKYNNTLESDTKITDGEAISLYMLSLRERALSHLYGDGITVYRNNHVAFKSKVTEADIENITKYVESNYAELLKGVKELYHVKSQKWYNATLKKRTGFEQELEPNYFPMHGYRNDFKSNVGSTNELMMQYQEFLNPSFTKDVHDGATNALEIQSIVSLTNTYVEQMSNYAGISPTIQQINKLFNMPTEANGEKTTLMKYMVENVDPGFKKYLNTLLINIQGRRTSGRNQKIFSTIRGLSAQVALGANLKVFTSQALSLPMAISELGTRNVVAGAFSMRTDYNFMIENSPYFKQRFQGNGAQMSQNVITDTNAITTGANSVVRGIKKVADVMSKPISRMDRFTIGKIFNCSIYSVAKEHGVTVKEASKNRELMLEALKLCETVTRRTQPQYDALETGPTVYEAGEIQKSFYMYSSVTRNYTNEVLLKLHDFIVGGKKNGKVLIATVSGLLVSQLLVAMLSTAVKEFLGKLDKDEDEEKVDDLLKDFTINSLENISINMIPFAKDVYNYLVHDYDISNVSLEYVTDLLDSVEYIENLSSADPATQKRAIYNLSKNIGLVFGIPVKNITEYTTGVMAQMAPEVGVRTQNILYFMDNSESKKQMSLAYKQNRTSIVKAQLATVLQSARLDIPSTDSSLEIARLYSEGYQQVIPSTTISSFSVNGTTYNLTDTAQKKFGKIYNEATAEIDDLISSSDYSKLSDEQKAKAIKRLYNAYYGVAKSELVSEYELSQTEEALYHMDGSDLVLHLAKIDNFKSTTAKTRKEQVLAYIQKLRISSSAKKLLTSIAGYGD